MIAGNTQNIETSDIIILVFICVFIFIVCYVRKFCNCNSCVK